MFPPDHKSNQARRRLIDALKAQASFPSIIKHPESTRVPFGESVSLSVEISNEHSHELTYQWFFSGNPIDGGTASTLSVADITSENLGHYHVEIGIPALSGIDSSTLRSNSAFLTGPDGIAKGGLQKDVFLNIPSPDSRSLSGLTRLTRFPHAPDAVGSIGAFELPANFGDKYGVRMHGFLVPPKSGEYVFYLVSDDSSELFLSTDESPKNKTKIASLTGWNETRRGWQTLGPDNISAPITLQAGKRYWVEALFTEQTHGDHFAVTWKMPGKPPPENGDPPIPGEFLEFQLE